MLSNNQLLRLILGFKVRYLRQQLQLSYQELSEKTGLSTSYLNDIEKGKKYPRAEKINALASAFGVEYDDLVSTKSNKRLQPVIDLVSSRFFKIFPLEEFGIDAERLLELFTRTPERVNAFISSVFNLARHYQIDEEQFYKVALRSWQDMHDNYFPDLEDAVKAFREKHELPNLLEGTKHWEEILKQVYNIHIDRQRLAKGKKLLHIRSYYAPKAKCLFLKKGLDPARENFLIARELGFQYLNIKERPFATRIQKLDSFEKLLNNFRASYFAAALLMDESLLVEDIRNIARQNTWQPKLLHQLLIRYQVTQETLLQRLTNLLPKHFGLEDLFFIRMAASKNLRTFRMTKELHLSQLHNPYRNELDEHYCRRWISVNILKNLSTTSLDDSQIKLGEAQISHYWQSDNSYLCLSFAHNGTIDKRENNSVTLGILINQQLRAEFNFLNDTNLIHKTVHTTCERCSIANCEARAVPPSIIEVDKERKEVAQMLESLNE